jgi:hypothetical protein
MACLCIPTIRYDCTVSWQCIDSKHCISGLASTLKRITLRLTHILEVVMTITKRTCVPQDLIDNQQSAEKKSRPQIYGSPPPSQVRYNTTCCTQALESSMSFAAPTLIAHRQGNTGRENTSSLKTSQEQPPSLHR